MFREIEIKKWERERLNRDQENKKRVCDWEWEINKKKVRERDYLTVKYTRPGKMI